MISKQPIYPDRMRQIPGQFSWVDHRLVRDGHIDRCCHAFAALYLFLITVSDNKGLSYYSDGSLVKRLNMVAATLERSRNQLIHLGMIAYKRPVDLFEQEQKFLHPLPRHPYDIAAISQVRASRQFRITLDTNRYSVPAEYAGELLTLKSYPDRLCIYAGEKLIARHPRSYDRHQDFEDPDISIFNPFART